MTEQIKQLPPVFIARLTRMVGEELTQKYLAIFDQERVTTLRVNTLKTTAEELVEELAKANFKIEPVSWLPNGFILREGTLFDLTQQPAYLEGRLYVQGLSSQIPPIVLDPKDDDLVLDIAAAPGSKTTQIAALMHNQGHIFANDTSRVRLFKLKANLETLGVKNVQVVHGMGQNIGFDMPLYFTKALADVPCSMEGRFNTNKPKTFNRWSNKKIKELATRQKALLRAAVRACRPGAEIVYSTCTLAPEENEGVVAWLLKKEPQIKLLDINLPNAPLSPAIKEWNNKAYPAEVVEKTKRIWPTTEVEGFYIAKMRVE